MNYRMHQFPTKKGEKYVIQCKESGPSIWMNYKENDKVVMSYDKQEIIDKVNELNSFVKPVNHHIQSDYGYYEG